MARIFSTRRPANSEESRTGSNLEPEVRTALVGRVDRELAKRSISGALVYFVVAIVLAFSTPYYSEHPVILVLICCVTLLVGGVRMIAAWRLLRQPADAGDGTKLVFISAIYATFGVWGVFCAWTFHLYGGEWTAMFLLLNTAALAGGATSSLAPSIHLVFRCLTVMILPTIITAFTLGGNPRYLGLGVVASIYLAFLITQARGNWREFWAASVAAERERVRGSAELRQAEMERTSLAAAIEQAAEEILITDVEGNIRYCNLAFEHSTGYSRSEVIGRNPRFLKSGKHDAELYRVLWNTILNGRVWGGRFTNRKKDGSLYEVEGTTSPILDAGKISGFVSARRDVTERLQVESQLRQAQKMESVGRLAGGVAHDFNNLLTIINGYAQMVMEQTAEKSPQHAQLQEILKAGGRAASLTRQLLAFSRKQVIEPRVLDMNDVLTNLEKMLRPLIGEDIELRVIPAPQPGQIKADPAQVEQVILNLAVNARDAMPRGGKLVIETTNAELDEGYARTHAEATPGIYVMLAVSDTGCGVTPENLSHIFEPFFTTKEIAKGTGLGLATVYGIVKQSGGHISVYSEVGRGSTFKVYWPRLDQPVEEPGQKTKLQVKLTGSETILVVEDEPAVRALISDTLEPKGFRVLVAGDGKEAMALAGRFAGPIHLLLTDVIMPDFSGKELADRLRPSRRELKVLFISGYTAEMIAHHGVLEEGLALLPKPFTSDTLIRKVRAILDEQKTA